MEQYICSSVDVCLCEASLTRGASRAVTLAASLPLGLRHTGLFCGELVCKGVGKDRRKASRTVPLRLG